VSATTFTIAQHTGSDALGGTTTDATITFANSQAAKNLNIVIISWGGAVTISSITDQQGNAYAQLGTSAANDLAIWYCLSIGAHAAGNVVTIHFSAASTAPEAWLIEANTNIGSWIAGPFDVGVGATGTAISSNGVMLGGKPALGVAAAISGNGSTVTAGTNWTPLDALTGSDQDQWRQVNSAGQIVATASQGVSANWDIVAGYFFVTGGVRARLLPLGI